MHGIRVHTAGGRSFGLTPWLGFHASVNGQAFKLRTLKHWTFVMWALELMSLKLWAFEGWALEWWHHFHGVWIRWSLHTSITRVTWATAPFQLCDGLMCHFVDWFVQQAISEGINQVLVTNTNNAISMSY